MTKTTLLAALLIGCKHPTPQTPMDADAQTRQAAAALATGASVAALAKLDAQSKGLPAACFAWSAVGETAETAAAVLATGGASYPALSIDVTGCLDLLDDEPIAVELDLISTAVSLVVHQVELVLAERELCEVEAAVQYVGGVVGVLLDGSWASGRVEVEAVTICEDD